MRDKLIYYPLSLLLAFTLSGSFLIAAGPDSTITALTAAGSKLTGAETFPCVDSGTTKKCVLNKVSAAGVIYVDGYGADSTGVADSTTAIQNAINAVPANGGMVVFGVGTYKTTSIVTVAANGVHLIGQGLYATRILFVPTGNATCLSFTKGASIIFSSSMQDMEIYSTETTFTKIAVNVSDASGFTMENVLIDGTGVGTRWSGANSIALQIEVGKMMMIDING